MLRLLLAEQRLLTSSSAAWGDASSSGHVQADRSSAAADVSGLEQAMRAVAAVSRRAAADVVSLEQAVEQHADRVSEALFG